MPEKQSATGLGKGLGQAPKAGSANPADQPEVAAPVGRFSLFFTSIVPVTRLANKRRIDQVDLPGLIPSDGAAVQYAGFTRNYAKKQLVGAAILPLINPLIILGSLLFAVNVATLYVGPIVLQQFLYLIQDEQTCTANAEAELAGGPAAEPCESRLWFGYVLAAVLLVSKIVGSFCLSHSEMLMTRAALRSRSAIMSALFRKCLRLAGVQETSTGQVRRPAYGMRGSPESPRQ